MYELSLSISLNRKKKNVFWVKIPLRVNGPTDPPKSKQTGRHIPLKVNIKKVNPPKGKRNNIIPLIKVNEIIPLKVHNVLSVPLIAEISKNCYQVSFI